jgi:hypothetical protein
MKTPLSASDLRRIAKSLDDFERLLLGPNGYRERAELVTRIEIMRPDDTEVIGHLVLVDEWIGFSPKEDKD